MSIAKQVILTVLAVLALFVVVVIGYYTVEVIKARQATPSIVQTALQSELIVLDIGDLSQRQIDILLAVEDPNFYHHRGWDFSTSGAGMTTITQGLVKIHYFDHYRQGLPKIRQTLIARFALDPLVSKEDQLLLFINEAHLGQVEGREVLGFAAASQAYFGKAFSELIEEEYLGLVAMLAGPGSFNVRYRPEANEERVRRVSRLVAGECTPNGWMDWLLEGCE
jgi:membrane carboxypeptidase/penicillin-binding protein